MWQKHKTQNWYTPLNFFYNMMDPLQKFYKNIKDQVPCMRLQKISPSRPAKFHLLKINLSST